MAWYNASWTYRVKITVDNTKVDADLTDFPVYVNLADLVAGFHTNVKANGADIRVTKSDGTTEVPREVVFYDSATDTGELHFKADGTLSNTVDTDFYIYYGNAGASEPAVTDTYGRNNVWDSSYKAVYHMQEDPSGNGSGAVKDSTSSGFNMTPAGSPVSGTGKMGNGIQFDNTNDILTGSGANLTGSVSSQIWVSTGTTADYDSLIDSQTSLGVANDQYNIFFQTGRVIASYGNAFSNATNLITLSTLTKLDLTYNGSTLTHYKDGVSNGTPAYVKPSVTTSFLAIGARTTSSNVSNALIDEVRISNVARASTWISTEYNNQNSSSTFYTDGAQETDGGGSTPTASFLYLMI